MSSSPLSLIPSMEENPFDFLKIKLNPDGSLSRPNDLPTILTSDDPSSKDLPLNPSTGTFLRLFRPRSPVPAGDKLPVIFYFHGGGFILFGVSISPFHLACSDMSSQFPALILSVDYRLAPEHRLPAAYHDALDAISWLRDQARRAVPVDPWIDELADFSRVFLMGNSSGGNIAYNAALRSLDIDVEPVRIAGIISDQPYFGGAEVSDSEKRLAHDRIVPLHANHLMWSLALPEGADREHEYCNPENAADAGEKLRRLPSVLVRGHGGDPLIDRQRAFARMLKERGARVVESFEEGGFHAIELFDPSKSRQLHDVVRDFIYGPFSVSAPNDIAPSSAM